MCLSTAREQPDTGGYKALLAGKNKAFSQQSREGRERCDSQGLGEFLQMLIEHFLALRQSAVPNYEECLEHIWTQEKD